MTSRRKTKQATHSHQQYRYFFIILTAMLILSMNGCTNYSDNSADIALFDGTRLAALDGNICQDMKTKKMWMIDKSKRIESLADAKKYTSSLKAGGYDNWRLPTVAELFELYMLFDLHQNGTCQIEVEGTYWSDEPDNKGRVGAWELDDNCDAERQYIPKKKGYVRAIRSPEE
jgi:hypothetical protein